MKDIPVVADLRSLTELVLTDDPTIWKAAQIERYLATKDKLSRDERKQLRFLLRGLVNHWDTGERNDAAELLGEIGTWQDHIALKNACSDAEMTVRCAARSSLAYIGKKRVFSFLKALVEDPDPVVRRWTYVAIYDTGHKDAVAWLKNRLGHECNDVARVGLLSALRRSGDEGVVEELTRLTQHVDFRLRELARRALDYDFD